MTVSLNTVTSNTAFQPYVPTVGQSTTAATSALSSQAVSLSAQSAVVALLGGSTGATVYSPSGLMNSLTQAGTVEEPVTTPVEGSHTDTTNAAQLAQDQGIVSTLSSSATGSGVYSGTGSVGGAMSEQAASNWADLLKTNPNLASTVISNSFTMGIVSSLSVTA
ncbi:hypothetical protein GJ697_17880 [Pseudoduganella sp. FT25W]|uniref:Uncharacterized protein n=1 Tax=Duganella alba TaxID=2666081 RepID=A0A6L5QIY4_9BURK|nr:hypothetical protein [Duganella alba]MRX09709.1 hypothetical protein [Duganella alba]MRX17346.1 hypothetical protein [Duganella alba]